MTDITLYLILGLVTGVLGGLLGLAGGVIIVPALVLLFGLSQHQAQGTSLALMLPPIGLLAVLEYYKHGYVNLKIAAFVCIGFFLGGLFGAKAAVSISNNVLQKVFGAALFLISLKMIFFK
ncbi:MAG: sulfite exporter TauE/SafE family protein [Elusimicrobiota bacterium]